MCFRQKCGFLTFNIISKPSCLNERALEQITNNKRRRHKNHTVQLSRVNPDIPICNKLVWIFLWFFLRR